MGVYLRVDEHWQPGAHTIAYYPLNSTHTDTDQSGNGYNGTTTGTITYSSEYCTMNGTQYIDIPTIIPYGSNPFTISVWGRYPSGGGGAIYQQYNSSTNNTAITLDISNGTCGFWSKGSNDWNNITTTSSDTWYNIIVTYTGNLLTLYKNGEAVGTKSRTISSTAPNLARIGYGGETWSFGLYNGNISNLIIEDKTRTTEEVVDYYNLTKSLYGIS